MPVNVDRFGNALDTLIGVKELQDVVPYQLTRTLASWYRNECTLILLLSIIEKKGTQLLELISVKEPNLSLLMDALLKEL